MTRKAVLAAALASFAATAPGLKGPIDYTDLHPIVAPTVSPTVTKTDPWRCATEDPMTYLSMPVPTGELQDAHVSFGSSLIETCLTSGTYDYPCAFPDKSRWCGFTTAMPTSLLLAYTAYARDASSWWVANSASIIRIAEECPIMWYQASNFGVLGGALYLNHTLINAQCYAEANTTLAESAPGPTATPGQGATETDPTSTSGAQPAQTSSFPNSGRMLLAVPNTMLPVLAMLLANAATPAPNTDGEPESCMGLCNFACGLGHFPATRRLPTGVTAARWLSAAGRLWVYAVLRAIMGIVLRRFIYVKVLRFFAQMASAPIHY
ncbi:uncharacterized protein B0H64DRAFT_471728 [Chaetomium fimeti]|uniref:DUF7735 domain-containing protein n=1 Tax=Chaetomium fimeti TaxID=1854472 RepID=A0AAE0LUX7_9PEZI|nr:hypothetical protein B0H64DRAFT_471728 [Chaetomium fimeti]